MFKVIRCKHVNKVSAFYSYSFYFFQVESFRSREPHSAHMSRSVLIGSSFAELYRGDGTKRTVGPSETL
jgi:hypothetical protein